MNITNVLTVNIENVPVTEHGKRVYKALLSTGARTTAKLSQHIAMSKEEINLMLAHLYRHDIIKLEE